MGQEFNNAIAIQALYNRACNEAQMNIPPQVFKEALETKTTSSELSDARDMYTGMAIIGGMSGNPLLATTGVIEASLCEQKRKILNSIGK